MLGRSAPRGPKAVDKNAISKGEEDSWKLMVSRRVAPKAPHAVYPQAARIAIEVVRFV